jgi:hypothetical protein
MWHKLTDNPEHKVESSGDSTKPKNDSKDGEKPQSKDDRNPGTKDDGNAPSKKDEIPKKE